MLPQNVERKLTKILQHMNSPFTNKPLWRILIMKSQFSEKDK